MKSIFIHIIKGAIMGAANVIPGVSGGTMALVMGIYERLINSCLLYTSDAADE